MADEWVMRLVFSFYAILMAALVGRSAAMGDMLLALIYELLAVWGYTSVIKLCTIRKEKPKRGRRRG